MAEGAVARRADDLEPSLHAQKRAKPLANPLGTDADLGGDRDGRQGVPDVVRADQPHREGAEPRPAPCRRERRRFPGHLEIVRLPVRAGIGAGTQSERLDPRPRRRWFAFRRRHR